MNEHGSCRQVLSSQIAPSGAAPVVLVVDDDLQCGRTIERLLSSQGYVTRLALDGASDLKSIEQEPPDLVLLDVQMTGPDGFQVCRLVKEHPVTRLTPVVLLTGLTARLRSLVRAKRYTDDLESAESVIMSLALTVESRDAYRRHRRRLRRDDDQPSLSRRSVVRACSP
jgi:putative two-component system response regulator